MLISHKATLIIGAIEYLGFAYVLCHLTIYVPFEIGSLMRLFIMEACVTIMKMY